MKKGIVLSIIMLMMSVMSFANEEPTFIGTQIELEVKHVEPETSTIPQKPRTPIVIPIIYTDGISLFFYTPCNGYTIYISDTEGNICYETVVPYGAEELTLPEYLSGEYELRIIQGSTCYSGLVTVI